jgi:photosystem II stability/assembly factor-like uncharacterized protein
MFKGSFWMLLFTTILVGTGSFGCSDSPTTSGVPSSSTGWHWQNPLPQGDYLWDAAILDDVTAIVVGSHGIVRTENRGRTWEVVSTGDDLFLSGVSFGDPNHGLAVGDRGRVLRTVDGGETWEDRSIEDRDAGLYDVFLYDEFHGTAVGYQGRIFHTTDGGITWIRQNSGVTSTLKNVWFTSADTGFVVGDGRMLRTEDGGTIWEPMDASIAAGIAAISFAGSSRGIIVGSVCRTTENAGASWQEIALGTDIYLMDARFVTSDEVLAVGYKFTDEGTWKAVRIWISNGRVERQEVDPDLPGRLEGIASAGEWILTVGGSAGHFSQSLDQGVSWVRQDQGSRATLYGVADVSDRVAVAVGTNGTILRTWDSGSSWKICASSTTAPLMDVCFTSPYVGLIVGWGGTILRTTDGGESWSSVNSGTNECLYSVTFITHTKALAVGCNGTILATQDAGLTWQPRPSGSQSQLVGVDFADALTGIAVSGEGSGTVLRTTDGGQSWSHQVLQPWGTYSDVCFVGARQAWIVGYDNVVLRTRDAGENWEPIPFPYGELMAVDFSDTTNGIGVGYFGAIYWTFDGGETWSKDTAITSNFFWDVTLSASRTATAVGQQGTILKTETGPTP